MPNGTIKRIVADRGFGFIAGADGTEYFFHRNSIGNFDSLRGDVCAPEISDGDGSPRIVAYVSNAPARVKASRYFGSCCMNVAKSSKTDGKKK